MQYKPIVFLAKILTLGDKDIGNRAAGRGLEAIVKQLFLLYTKDKMKNIDRSDNDG